MCHAKNKVVTKPNWDIFSEAKVNAKSKNIALSTVLNHPELKLESSKGTLHQTYGHENTENEKKKIKAIQSTEVQLASKLDKCPYHQKSQLLKEVVSKKIHQKEIILFQKSCLSPPIYQKARWMM